MSATDFPGDRRHRRPVRAGRAGRAPPQDQGLHLLGGARADDHQLVASLRPSPTMAGYGLACVFLYLPSFAEVVDATAFSDQG
jgi:hypothetical protein